MGRWTKGKTLSVQEVRMKNGLVHGTIDCLTEGSEYMFRIKAVNKGGPSEPSDPSDSMIAKIRFSKKNAHSSLYIPVSFPKYSPTSIPSLYSVFESFEDNAAQE